MDKSSTRSINACMRADLAGEILAMHQCFSHATPFPHIVLNNFLDDALCSALIEQFPTFESGNYLNEAGKASGKSVHESLGKIGPAFEKLDRWFQSSNFLDCASGVTGIPNLLFDPHYFGGGTHENKPGQQLDIHIDFNRHPTTHWYRRLNLLIYLNEPWFSEWGGSLELHSNPYGDDEVIEILPVRNRCVIFETSEHSWHGFKKIDPKIGTKISRKSIAIYLYTIDPPSHDNGKIHSTLYVDRPIPSHFVERHILSKSDVNTLKILFARRDQHIRRPYKEISFEQTSNGILKARIEKLHNFPVLKFMFWVKRWLIRFHLLKP
ncbi:MAG: 2OG-Fe(II) oxygenase [Gammaproteobacteria bacterium]